MKRAAIVVHSHNANRIMFWVLGKPRQIGSINVLLGGEEYHISIFEIPYVKDDKHKEKQRAITDKFLKEEDIKYILYADEVDEELERIWATVKIIRILEEIGSVVEEYFLNKSFGIIGKKPDTILLEALSREASSIIVLNEGQDVSLMEELHKKIITETGLSIAFISDASYLINQSRIIILESSDEVEKYKRILPYPPLCVKETLVMPKVKDEYNSNTLEIKYAEEIGKLIAKIISEKNIREITCYYPNIYFLKENGILTNLKKSNKILTIQKC
ncbi:hypothetical protein [Lutispora thermophila]|uniref:Uncharacterized protein n=1 Tax=Lutispora thermophila DSM 19022 TaxID=1122184 RepID=A0A1M6GGT7_9FIRM|nr:hypothetical protein [Lutispora thermophila]SHJ09101.1 hypothetical protein SAMN02745176_02383 [Lutispora thermophila DSM 19022]